MEDSTDYEIPEFGHLEQIIVDVRDRYPRRADDAPSSEIAEAVLDAGYVRRWWGPTEAEVKAALSGFGPVPFNLAPTFEAQMRAALQAAWAGFSVGDRVYCPDPINEDWPPHYTATVTGISEGGIDIVWDHGPHNYGQNPAAFARRNDRDCKRCALGSDELDPKLHRQRHGKVAQ